MTKWVPVAVGLLFGLTCGACSSDPSPASSAQNGVGGDACSGQQLSAAPGRPSSPVCEATSFDAAPSAGAAGSGGGMGGSCTSNQDCEVGMSCFAGQCGFDACLTDTDCPGGQACACAAGYYGGNAIHGNRCIEAKCRTDDDCQAGSTCEESFGGYCGSPIGFFCHTRVDTCHTDKDCCSDTPQCAYQPTLARWACQALAVCAG